MLRSGATVVSDRIINTSGKDRWGTPPEVLRWVRRNIGPITLDAAADEQNAVCGAWLPDAFAQEWPAPLGRGVVWCNPPYSRAGGGLAAWCEAMANAGQRMTVVGLFFARTETVAWHEYVSRADRVYFLRRRLRFIDPDTGKQGGSAPAPSVIAVWRPGHQGPPCYRNLDLRAGS